MLCAIRFLAPALVMATMLHAQLTVSTIRGTATDPSGAAVAGANIALANVGTNIQMGHGGGGFLWPVATGAMKQGFTPDSISTDCVMTLRDGKIVNDVNGLSLPLWSTQIQ